ncbi:carbohydrate porin [Synechococcus sp. CBW1002]|nr:carbohydrate porin [Synechococcus sp. CBW1002]
MAWMVSATAPLLAQDIPIEAPQPATEDIETMKEVAKLEALHFAPTTTVQLQINGALGALHYTGSAIETSSNTAAGAPLLNGLSFNHETRLTIDTSVTGQDLLRIRFRAGNFARSGFVSNAPTPLSRLDFAFQEPGCTAEEGNCAVQQISINRAYLQIPLTPEIRFSFGARIMQLDMLPVWPSVYNQSPILDLFQYAGAPGAYSKRLGGGFGAWWQPKGSLQGLSLGFAYVAGRAGSSAQGGGLFSANSGQTSTIQLALTRPQWNITGAYTLSGAQVRLRGTPLASQLAEESSQGSLGSWSVAGYWQPRSSGWLPSISVGWGHDSFRFGRTPVADGSSIRTRSWYAGLVWSDVLGQGNSLGFAVGSPAHVTAIQAPGLSSINDGGLAYELSYRIEVSDRLTLTPAVFWLSRPRGAMTTTSDLSEALLSPAPSGNASLGVWAGVIRTTLRF